MPALVYSTGDVLVSDQEGGTRLLKRNEPFRPDHAIVRAYPGLFSDTPDLGEIESATANPGERRNVRHG